MLVRFAMVVGLAATFSFGCHDDRCFGRKIPISLAALPTRALVIKPPTLVLDTDTSPLCSQTDRQEYCVLVGTGIFVDGPVRATGHRPLVLLATDTIVVGALIDVGSHRDRTPEVGAGADPSGCAPAPRPKRLCPGRNGEGEHAGKGGHGGGSVLLIAGERIIAGTRTAAINAQGEDGEDGVEPGDGGAGGMVILDTPRLGSDKGNPLAIDTTAGKQGIRRAKGSAL